VFYTHQHRQLIVESSSPSGRIFDPACGSGGMLVHSAAFVKNTANARWTNSPYRHREGRKPRKLAKMNLLCTASPRHPPVQHLLRRPAPERRASSISSWPIRPFNVSGVDKERIQADPRFPIGMPSTDNANYLWISLFWSSLNASGPRRASSWQLGRRRARQRAGNPEKLIQSGAVDAIVAIGPNFFYTVTCLHL